MLHRALACLAVLPKKRPESISTLSPEEVLHANALSLPCGSSAATHSIGVPKPSLLICLSSHLRCIGGTRAASRRGRRRRCASTNGAKWVTLLARKPPPLQCWPHACCWGSFVAHQGNACSLLLNGILIEQAADSRGQVAW